MNECYLLVHLIFRGFDIWAIYLFKMFNGKITGAINPQGLVD